MIKPLAILLISMLAMPTPADTGQAQSLPAISEPSWTFIDNGNVYLIGKQSGSVTIIRSGDKEPEKPRPKPPPLPIPDTVVGVKWFSVIVDPNNPEQAGWRTDSALRSEVERKAINYRSYLSNESDIDTLGFRSSLQSTGTPCVILQDATGKMVKTIRPTNLADIMTLLEAIK
jgi:hypothetical protein